MKLFVIVIPFLVSCSWISSDFDESEYLLLSQLKVITDWSDSCNPNEINSMKMLSRTLVVYSKGRLNSNISEIYQQINALVEELSNNKTPNDTYCAIKREYISTIVDKTLNVYGDRL